MISVFKNALREVSCILSPYLHLVSFKLINIYQNIPVVIVQIVLGWFITECSQAFICAVMKLQIYCELAESGIILMMLCKQSQFLILYIFHSLF